MSGVAPCIHRLGPRAASSRSIDIRVTAMGGQGLKATPPHAEVLRRDPEPGEAAAVTRAGKFVFEPYTALAKRHAQHPDDLTFSG